MNIFEHILEIENIESFEENSMHLFKADLNSSILSKQAYWTHNNPWDLENDSDFDGISDALDYHVGPGAFNE